MLQPEDVLQGRYRILRQLGGGGFGTVYLAEDKRLAGRQHAVKEISPSQVADEDQEWAISAFRQEAEILVRLSHPGIAAVTDFFAERGNWYQVMEYVPGQTLGDVLKKAPNGRLSEQRALDITDQLCEVLSYLHAQQPPVVFRDLKPDNVMLTPEGRVKLIDFGIARFFKPGVGRDTVALGTPGYAAPEQYGRGQSDVRTDVYGLGVLLHQMLTGYDPTASPFRLPPVDELNPHVSDRVCQAIRRATEHDPGQRYPSVDAFCAALKIARSIQPVPFRSIFFGTAHSLDELARLCDRKWTRAVYHLYKGNFERWLKSIGERDLANKARNIRLTVVDKNEGLEKFLHLIQPSLDRPLIKVSPERIDYGSVDKGWNPRTKIHVENTSRGYCRVEFRSDSEELGVWPFQVSLRGRARISATITLDTTVLSHNKLFEGALQIVVPGLSDKTIPIEARITHQNASRIRLFSAKIAACLEEIVRSFKIALKRVARFIRVSTSVPAPAVLNIRPDEISLNAQAREEQLILTNEGEDTLVIRDIALPYWLKWKRRWPRRSIRIGGGRSKKIHLALASGIHLADGRYRGDIRFLCSAGEKVVTVTLVIGGQPKPGIETICVPLVDGWKEKFDKLIKRDKVIVALDRIIRQPKELSGGTRVLLVAPRYYGATSVVRSAIEKARMESEFIVYHSDLATAPQVSRKSLLENIVWGLSMNIPGETSKRIRERFINLGAEEIKREEQITQGLEWHAEGKAQASVAALTTGTKKSPDKHVTSQTISRTYPELDVPELLRMLEQLVSTTGNLARRRKRWSLTRKISSSEALPTVLIFDRVERLEVLRDIQEIFSNSKIIYIVIADRSNYDEWIIIEKNRDFLKNLFGNNIYELVPLVQPGTELVSRIVNERILDEQTRKKLNCFAQYLDIKHGGAIAAIAQELRDCCYFPKENPRYCVARMNHAKQTMVDRVARLREKIHAKVSDSRDSLLPDPVWRDEIKCSQALAGLDQIIFWIVDLEEHETDRRRRFTKRDLKAKAEKTLLRTLGAVSISSTGESALDIVLENLLRFLRDIGYLERRGRSRYLYVTGKLDIPE